MDRPKDGFPGFGYSNTDVVEDVVRRNESCSKRLPVRYERLVKVAVGWNVTRIGDFTQKKSLEAMTPQTPLADPSKLIAPA